MHILRQLREMRSPFPEGLRSSDYVRIRRSPHLKHGKTRLFGRPFHFSDNNGFVYSLREIFVDQVYLFKAKNETPLIVDAGANIGLSVLYFKKLYPQSSIVAFEPDPVIYAMLTQNVGAMADVELRQEAAWIEDTTLTFFSEGSLAGSSEIQSTENPNKIEVKASRLKDLLENDRVDFLKIDIEGAENSVLFDIEDNLDNVDHLFFEYHSISRKTQQLGDMLNLVRRKGFRYVINGTHGSSLPFIKKTTKGFDLQANVFCFRPE